MLLAGKAIDRAVSMTIRFGTASSAISLDFIDVYCLEYPTNLRYSRGVLNNISIKQYTQPLRRCGCALVCKLCCQQAGNLEFGVLCRQKPERGKNPAYTSAEARPRHHPLHQSTFTPQKKV